MKALHQLLLALVLTIPIYLGLANSPLDDWFQSGAGWRAFEPLCSMPWQGSVSTGKAAS
ncbi:hypothetical protein [Burkholderia gladioli]|uniref:hypothetical protein n=1 Tax=Burkholderia gladioli TaxID=28095 RepID=UPI001FC82207|nr:hypothetical protein [Burkholderia gladioli]